MTAVTVIRAHGGDVPCSSESIDAESMNFEQDVVDYGWEVFSRMFIWALQVSCYLALLEIPEGFVDSAEICRVEKLFNERQIRGTGRLVDKPQFRCGRASDVCMKRLRKRSGQMHELKCKFEKQACRGDIYSLSCSLFGKLVTAEENNRELTALNQQIEDLDRRSKIEALIHWRHRLQSKKGVKGKWLQPNVLPRLVKIRRGDAFTSTKEEALMVLRDHWMGLIDSVAWEQDDRARETAKLISFFSMRLPSDSGIRRPVPGSSVELPPELLIGRPDSGSFAEALKSVRGCPGIDGWSSEEISLLCGNKFMLNKAWAEMATWEEMGLAPSSMRDGLLHFIPKPGKVGSDGCCTCKDLRPLSILSVFWRAWSGAWVKSPMMIQFVQHFLPGGLIASFKGGCGCEILASAMAHELSRLGFGATLDFSFCFDTIDLLLLKDSLNSSLHSGLVRWSNLLLGHWLCLRRWLSCSGSILQTPLCSPCGIPQGDPASPLMLALFLWEGFNLVNEFLLTTGAESFQGIYMDDRTVLSCRPDVVEGAVQVWNSFARQRKLIENMEKAQWVSTSFPIAGYADCMEVLGVIIGLENYGDISECPKQKKRLDKAAEVIHRVGLLPQAKWMKLVDYVTFTQGIYSYGWVTRWPSSDQKEALLRSFNNSFGEHRYGVAVLKRLLLFVHLDATERTFVHQVRMLAKRDLFLQTQGINVVACALDHMVDHNLKRFGWTLVGSTWSLAEMQFQICQCCDGKAWGRIGHDLRESVRRWHYQQLFSLSRHEFLDQHLPPYSADRIKLVKLWMKQDSVAILLATGSIPSALSISKGQGFVVPCPKCGMIQAYWDHYWECWIQQSPPDDLLLRRFLWPRSRKDFGICDLFKDWAGPLISATRSAVYVG